MQMRNRAVPIEAHVQEQVAAERLDKDRRLAGFWRRRGRENGAGFELGYQLANDREALRNFLDANPDARIDVPGVAARHIEDTAS